MASSAEGIGCPTLRYPKLTKIAPLTVALVLIASACSGEVRPEPEDLLDRAFSRISLSPADAGPTAVEVASLGFRDRVLEAREVPVSARTHREILDALSSGPGSEGAAIGIVSVARDLETGARGEVAGVESWPVSGTIETGDLLEALARGGGEVAGELGVGGIEVLGESLVGVAFTAWVSAGEDRLERLDLVVELDDPGNALPPSRLRFRLDEASSAAERQDNSQS